MYSFNRRKRFELGDRDRISTPVNLLGRDVTAFDRLLQLFTLFDLFDFGAVRLRTARRQNNLVVLLVEIHHFFGNTDFFTLDTVSINDPWTYYR